MNKHWLKRLLSLVLVVVLCMSVVLPAAATGASGSRKVTFEKVDNEEVSLKPSPVGKIEETSEPAPYGEHEAVRVSIVLKDAPTIAYAEAASVAVEDISTNSAAVNYRNSLKAKQDMATAQISKQALNGAALDVVWNLTLAANMISANVEYGQIEAIKAVPGVQDVVIENCYEPAVVSKGAADPNMATSSAMIGSPTAYQAGYTGAGSRVAIIDTGIDTDHQSFANGGYEYALHQLADKAGVSYEEYVAGLKLLTADQVADKADQLNVKIDASKTYITEKVPFAYNYVDEDYDITHDNDAQGEHGSHVAGIAAANSYIAKDDTYVPALESVLTQGVAPEAQLIVMKVFGKGGGAYDSDYMVAIEDAIILGADAINLSLGSGNPGNATNATYQKILDDLANSNVVVVMSAGNAYGWAESSQNYIGVAQGMGYLYSDGVSFDTVGSPGSYTNSLSVASADNTGATGAYVKIGDSLVFYNETTGYTNAPMTTIAGDHEYVLIDSVGTAGEFAAVKDVLKGKIAVCSRGSTSFFEKANAAAENGAIATIICNNQPGVINMNLEGYTYSAPCVSVSQAEGQLLKEAATYVEDGNYYLGTMTVSSSIAAGSNPDADVTMSDFSSWGIPGSLTMKPEITAPGGNIYSVNGAVPGGEAYELMSGTSMAAPQVAGMVALVAQYIREEGLAGKTGLSARQLAQSLLMSTAVPQNEAENGYQPYSVLKQGAGLANVGNAVNAESYIMMNEDATASCADGKVKAELGDDPQKSGVYQFSFTVNNLTDQEQAYDLSAQLFTQAVFDYYVSESEVGGYLDTYTAPLSAEAEWTVDGRKVVPAADELLHMDFNNDGKVNNSDATAILEYVTGIRTELNDQQYADLDKDGDIDSYDAYLFLNRVGTGAVTVPANGSVTVSVKLSLTDDQKKELNESYPAGAYVEGYVYLKALTTAEGLEGTTHSIPVLGYYGNWSESSMYDLTTWTEYCNGKGTDTDAAMRWNYMGTYYSNYVTIRYAGDSDEYRFGGNPLYYEAYDESRNAVNAGDTLGKAVFTLIRNAAAGRLTLTNTTKKNVELDQTFGETDSAYYYVNGGEWRNTTASKGLDISPKGDEGDQYVLSLTMAPEYYVGKDGSVNWDALGAGATLSIPFTIDNTAPEMAEATVNADKSLTIKISENQNLAGVTFYTSAGEELGGLTGDDFAVNADGTYSLENVDLGLDDDVYLLQLCDYAMNVSTYRLFYGVEATDEVESVSVTPEALTLVKGNSRAISAAVAPVTVKDDSVTWTSSNEKVATVNEDGVVTGVSKGTCVVTATSNLDKEKSASCQVEVITIDKNLNALVWDEEGTIWWSGFNTETLPAYEKYAEAGNGLAAVSYGPNNKLYAASLDTENLLSDLYEIDPETMAATKIGGSAEISYMDLSYAPNLGENGSLMAVYGPYVVMVDAETGEYTGAWPWSSSNNNLIGIAYGGSILNTYYNEYVDLFYLIDNTGKVSMEGFIAVDGKYAYFNGEGENSFLCNTGRNLGSTPYFNSAYYDGAYLYWSAFNTAENQVNLYAIDVDTTGNTYYLGSFAEGVWPVAGLFELNPVEGASVAETEQSTELAAKLATAAVSNAAMATDVEPIALPDSKMPKGSLNAVVTTGKSPVRPMSDTDVSEDENIVTLDVTAKNANGMDVASTNGKLTVNYDSNVFALKSTTVHAAYSSCNDAADGKVVIAYAGLDEIPAGTSVATLVLERKANGAGSVSVLHEQVNDQNPGYKELVPIDYSENPDDHTETELVGAKEPTWTEPGYTGDVVCVKCGTVLKKGFVIPATGTVIGVIGGAASGPAKPTAPMPFTDVGLGDWFYDDVKYVYENGLMNGTSDSKFSPYSTLTRAMVVTVLYRIEGEPATRYNGAFSDVADYEWYTDAVEWAAKNEIVTGYTTGKFGPNDAVTREQLAAILYRYAQLKGYDVAGSDSLSGCADSATVSTYAVSAVKWAVDGDMLLTTNGKLRPREAANRAEVAAAMASFYAAYVE